MSLEFVLFIIFSAVSLSSAILMVTRINPVLAALFLIVNFASLAGLYLLLNAQFIAIAQVIVYAGAIMVFFLFVIMLINPDFEKYDDGDVIIREGNNDNDFFELIQGAVIVVKGGKKIAEILQPGAFLGEMAAISGEPRSASIISKGRSTLRRFPGNKMYEVIENYPEVTKHLFKTMVSRLEHTNEIIMKLADGRKAR